MGGTTEEMIMPSTVAMSRPAGEKRLWSRMPHSSAVCSWTVRRRHWQTRLRPSKAPIVMLLFPASSASSTYASCQNQGIGSVVLPHHQIAFGVEPAGGSVNRTVRKVDDDAPSRGIRGGACKEAQNIVRRQPGVIGNGGKQAIEEIARWALAAGMESQRGGFQLRR